MPARSADHAAPLDEFLCFAVYSANLAFSRVYRPLLDSLGVTYVQYIVLVALWARDEQFVGELGDTLFLGSNTLTPVVKRLQALGYVRRSRDTQDERQVRVQLTKAGWALQKRAAVVPGCILTASGLQVAELQDLNAAVAGLRDRLLSSPPVEAPAKPRRRSIARSPRGGPPRVKRAARAAAG